MATKVCSQCKQVKDVAEFRQHKRSKDGLFCWCRPCANAQQRERYQADPEVRARTKKSQARPEAKAKHKVVRKRWAERNPEQQREIGKNGNLVKTYGITLAEYNRMVAERDGCCDVCGKKPSSPKRPVLNVDHDHATGKIRGLLCYSCNHGIGLLGDDASGVKRALAYLERAEDSTEHPDAFPSTG